MRALECEETRKAHLEQERQATQLETEKEKLVIERSMHEAKLAKQELDILTKHKIEKKKLAIEKNRNEAEIELNKLQLLKEQDIDQKRLDNQRFITETENQTKRQEIEVRSNASHSSIEHDTSHRFK